jgi:hypothetical protein
MTEPTISCPNCKTEIRLTESLAAPLLESTKKQYEQLVAAKEEQVRTREAALREQQAKLTQAQESLDEQVAEKLKTERTRIVAEEAKKARVALANEIEQKAKEVTELQAVLKERDVKLAEAQKAQADLIRKQRELDDAKRELELTIEKRVQESLVTAREQGRKQAEEELRLKVAEKEQTIASMQQKIEELKRKAEQGSQQLQGEVQEVELETILRTRFPQDTIDPVPKGEFGGDALHRVCGPLTTVCGTILWESKRTKHWSDLWLPKLREDQRAAKAELAVIVTQTLPKEIESFDFVENVWVTSPRTMIPVAVALRQALIELAAARQAGEGQLTKMEMVYRYLTGPQFRHRVQAIVEKFTEMQEDLEKERKTMMKLWARREKQIRCVVDSTAGMYGDLQGIAGRSLEEIDGLELHALPPCGDDDTGLE